MNHETKAVKEKNRSVKFNITVVYNNVQSLTDKLDELKTIADESKPEVFCCVETWLDKSHTKKEIEIKGYKCKIRNRSDKPNRGGVAIYFKNGIKAEEIPIPSHNTPCKCEAIWSKITSRNGKKIIMGLIYRSPQNTTFNEHLEGDINYITQLNLPVVLLGDFNYDLLNRSPNANALCEILERQSMDQIIKEPTRVTKTTKTLIDHIWVSDEEHVNGLQILPGMSDHKMCKFRIEIEYEQEKNKLFKYRQIHKKADKIAEELANQNWNKLQSIEEVETIWSILKTNIIEAIDKHAPIKLSYGDNKNQPWMTEELKNLARKKEAIQLSRATTSNQSAWNDIKKQVKRQTFIQKKNYYSKRIEDNKNNPDKLWKIIKEIAPSNFGNKKEEINMDKEMLDRLNRHFAGTGSRIQQQIEEENKNRIVFGSQQDKMKRAVSQINKIEETTEDNIKKIVGKINANKATGIDGIPVKVIKLGINILAKPITTLINKILNTGTFPIEFKTALVTPAHKKGDKSK